MKPLFLFLSLFFFTLSPASARVLEGDWQSSGDLPYVYEPDYSYVYSCQLEITDHERHAEGLLFAYARFTLSNEARWQSSLAWQWIRLGHRGEEIPTRDRFEISTAAVGLHFDRGGSPEEDTVTLHTAFTVPAGDYLVPVEKSKSGTRKDSEIFFELSSFLRSRDEKKTNLSRSAFVVCRKIR
jgi:hypothetical protein